jgi:hypothetical protein
MDALGDNATSTNYAKNRSLRAKFMPSIESGRPAGKYHGAGRASIFHAGKIARIAGAA